MHAQFEVLRLICHAAMLKVAWFSTTDDLTWSSQFLLAWHDDLKCQGEAQLITRLLALAQEEWSSFQPGSWQSDIKNPDKAHRKPIKTFAGNATLPPEVGDASSVFCVQKSNRAAWIGLGIRVRQRFLGMGLLGKPDYSVNKMLIWDLRVHEARSKVLALRAIARAMTRKNDDCLGRMSSMWSFKAVQSSPSMQPSQCREHPNSIHPLLIPPLDIWSLSGDAMLSERVDPTTGKKGSRSTSVSSGQFRRFLKQLHCEHVLDLFSVAQRLSFSIKYRIHVYTFYTVWRIKH